MRRGGAHRVLIERRLDLAGVAQALGHLEPQVARHQGRGLVGLEVVEVGPLLAADLEQVAEAVGGERPVLTPRCWIRALVATVVPWPK